MSLIRKEQDIVSSHSGTSDRAGLILRLRTLSLATLKTLSCRQRSTHPTKNPSDTSYKSPTSPGLLGLIDTPNTIKRKRSSGLSIKIRSPQQTSKTPTNPQSKSSTVTQMPYPVSNSSPIDPNLMNADQTASRSSNFDTDIYYCPIEKRPCTSRCFIQGHVAYCQVDGLLFCPKFGCKMHSYRDGWNLGSQGWNLGARKR